MAVARALIRVYALLKTNREMIGNSLPHLHTHPVLRFTDAPLPRQLFPLTAQQPDQHIPEALLLFEAAVPRSVLP